MWLWTVAFGEAAARPSAWEAAEAVLLAGAWERVAAIPLGGRPDADGYGPRGVAVRFVPVRDGLPVDAVRVVRLDADGAVVDIGGDPVPARVATEGAPLPVDQAQAIAARLVGGDPVGARLSWQPVRGVLRRMWTVERTGSGSPHAPRAPRVRLDAVTGAVESVDDAARDTTPAVPLARVYPHNPVVDAGTLAVVTLPLAVEGLSDDRVTVQQCRDLGETTPRETPDLDTLDLHVCTRVAADGPTDGHYLVDPVPWTADPGRDEDAFAAPHAYWHTLQGFAWFDALGWVPQDGFDPYTFVVVNHRTTDLWTEQSATDPAGSLAPYDNAYFGGGYTSGGQWRPPTLVFGQGAQVDYAYDGDVVAHELGHLVVASRNGPQWSPDGPYGPSERGGALNEGIADYFSSAMHGDPWVGEYASGDSAPIRDLGAFATCGASLYGEAHYDSLPFSSALWAVREALPLDDQTALDGIVLDALSVLGWQADFPDAAATILSLVGERLGPEAEDTTRAAFDARGLFDCPPVSDVTPGDTPFREYALLYGAYALTTIGAYPAPVQYRVEIPEGGARLTLSLTQPDHLGFDPWFTPPEPFGLVGRSGAEPIVWTRDDDTTPYTTTGGGHVNLLVTAWTPEATELGELVEGARRTPTTTASRCAPTRSAGRSPRRGRTCSS